MILKESLASLCIACVVSLPLVVGAQSNALRIHPTNPRYFTDNSGRAIYLGGSHDWTGIQRDSSGYLPDHGADPDQYFAGLKSLGHNHTRLWIWDAESHSDPVCGQPDCSYLPLAFEKTNRGYDLSKVSPKFLVRVQSAVESARKHGIWVTLMFFQGWSASNFGESRSNPFDVHPFRSGNNINGVKLTNGDKLFTCEMKTTEFAGRSVWSYQTAYVSTVMKITLPFENVMYEVGNEIYAPDDNLCWQRSMAQFIRDQTGGTRLVGLSGSYTWALGDWHEQIAAQEADWASPTSFTPDNRDAGGWINNPPTEYFGKPIISDNDHHGRFYTDSKWVWRTFTRGHHVLHMENGRDCEGEYCHEPLRQAIGATVWHSQRVDLAAMTPQPNACNSGFCLANNGREYVIYQPDALPIVLNNLPEGTYLAERYCALSNTLVSQQTIDHSGGNRDIARPSNCRDQWVAVLRRS